MGLFKIWRKKREQRKIERAIRKYNSTLVNLAKAAIVIGNIAKQQGISTEKMRSAISDICDVAQTSLITTEDLKTDRRRGK